jgi:hypothetical protein
MHLSLSLRYCLHERNVLCESARAISSMQAMSATAAAKLLEEDPDAQLVDIRTREELREVGSPDLREFGKSPINATFKPSAGDKRGLQTSTVTIGWPERLCRLPKVSSCPCRLV